jgi:heterodisulfide reductase subunit A
MTEDIRMGVYICHCGSNIANVVDVEAVRDFASDVEGVVVARDYKFMCSDPGQALIKEDIEKHNLNRVVVAACSPLMHEKTFRGACASAGMNQYLFQQANIREHCSWVTDDKEAATVKAKALTLGAVRKAAMLEPLETSSFEVNSNVMVIGGGIAGIQAALDIANAGNKVYLVEKDPSIGGHMAQFDKTFPTLDCAACILTPKMVSVGQHKNIEMLTYSEVAGVDGFVGNYKVKVRRKASYVDNDKCTGCGACMEKCPKKVSSEFEEGLGKRRAIYTPFAQAVPNKPVIDTEHCTYFLKPGKCGVCAKICEVDAIDFEQQERVEEIDVGSIIVATGYDLFQPNDISTFGYGVYPDVYTSLEFERLNSSAGPTGGKIVTKDGEAPERVAIVHCVGSRDHNYNQHCSKVCCMYSLKYAHLVAEKTGAEIINFYIDIRAGGKRYEEFYKRLCEEGTKFVRGKVAEITDVAEDEEEEGKLVVRAEDTLLGQTIRVPVDMVILSPAMTPRSNAEHLGRQLGLSRGPSGFFIEKHPKLGPVETATDGIYLAGTCSGPMDIPESVAQGSGAAAQALSLIQKGTVELEANTALVIEEHCSGCRTCIELCPYDAIRFDEDKEVAVIQEALCKGCGTCAAACPGGAIKSRHFTTQQVLAEIEGVLL